MSLLAITGSKPPVKLTWYDGGLLPPKPEELGTEEVDKGGGVLYVNGNLVLSRDSGGNTVRHVYNARNQVVAIPTLAHGYTGRAK